MPLDLTGKKFSKLVALEVSKGEKKRSWLCICDCGRKTIVPTNRLTSGWTTSCGCWKASRGAENGRKNAIHNRSNKGDRTYSTWSSMKDRVKEDYPAKDRYFDRGIKICERWMSFANFLEDMGERPEGMTLDRIDVNGNYEPSNCRWATAKEQQRNKTNTNYLIVDGLKVSAAKIAEDLGIKPSAMKYFVSVGKKLEKHYGFVPSIQNNMSNHS